MKLNNFKKFVPILALILLGFWLYKIDYNDLSWKANGSAYLGVIAMGFIFISGLKNFKTNK